MYDLILQDLIIYGTVVIYVNPTQSVLISNCTFDGGGIEVRTTTTMDETINTELVDIARHYMWERIAQETLRPVTDLNRTARKRARVEYARATTGNEYAQAFDVYPTEEDYQKARENPLNNNSIPCQAIPVCTYECAQVASPAESFWRDLKKVQQKEKENTMAYGYNETTSLETQQRNHLKRRLDEVQCNHFADMRKTYKLDAPEGPKTKADIMAALTGGKFTLDDASFDKDGKLRPWTYFFDSFSWRTADNQPDQAGFDAAVEKANAAYTAAKDTIIVGALSDGLKALQDFEAMSF